MNLSKSLHKLTHNPKLTGERMNEVNEASPANKVSDVERVVSRDEDVIASTPLDITDPIQYGAEQFWCAMRVLDDMNIPRSIDGEILSLVGRIKAATGTIDG